jgi:hypothetical protein
VNYRSSHLSHLYVNRAPRVGRHLSLLHSLSNALGANSHRSALHCPTHHIPCSGSTLPASPLFLSRSSVALLVLTAAAAAADLNFCYWLAGASKPGITYSLLWVKRDGELASRWAINSFSERIRALLGWGKLRHFDKPITSKTKCLLWLMVMWFSTCTFRIYTQAVYLTLVTLVLSNCSTWILSAY